MYLKPMTWWRGRVWKEEDEGEKTVGYVPVVALDIPCGRPVPIDERLVLDRNSSAFGDLQRKSELQSNKSEFEGDCFVLSRSRVVALPCISFLVPSSTSLFAEHSVITIATSLSLQIEFKLLLLTGSTLSGGTALHPLHCVPFKEFLLPEYHQQLSAGVKNRETLALFFSGYPGKIKQ
jgi:hypothetical protein